MAVGQVLDQVGLSYSRIELGSVVLDTPPDKETLRTLEESLLPLGFELVKTREMKLVETIKNTLVSLVSSEDAASSENISDLISERTSEDYTKLSNLFSSIQGITIERYFILLKIEKVKEWLSYGDYNISESAWKLGYSSIQHLSSQFKKITGMTPSQYKKLSLKPRKSLDEL
jgi:AraC-like DNA-binding protein